MKLPVYEMVINPEEESDVEVSFVALVDKPAIEKNFLAFKDEFVEPGPTEDEKEFIGRCIPVMIKEGYEQDQAAAICYDKWRNKMSSDFQESYSDYPDAVKNNAKAALKWAEENGWGSCGTGVGKQRANQLANGEPISLDTIKRMYSYLSRHAVDLENSKGYGDGCGKLMYDAWGGKSALSWAESKIRQAEKMRFAIQNEEEKIISGPLMLADTPIYRSDANGEYYVFFSKDTIKKIAQKYFKKGNQSNVNLMHDNGQIVEGVTMFESWIVDKERGISSMVGFEDVKDGSWFGSFKVENEEVWQKIKSGEVKGFSVEGVFGFVKPLSRTENEEYHSDIETLIMSEIKDLWSKFKEKFLAPEVVNMMTAKLVDGTEVTVDKLEIGGKVMIGENPAPAGEHTLEDGTVIVLGEGGIIEAIKPVEEPKVEVEVESKAINYDAKFEAIDAKFGEMVAAYEDKFNAQSAQLNEIAEKFAKANETINQLVELVGKIIETPTAESVTKTQGFNKQTSRVEKITRLAETLKQIKSK